MIRNFDFTLKPSKTRGRHPGNSRFLSDQFDSMRVSASINSVVFDIDVTGASREADYGSIIDSPKTVSFLRASPWFFV